MPGQTVLPYNAHSFTEVNQRLFLDPFCAVFAVHLVHTQHARSADSSVLSHIAFVLLLVSVGTCFSIKQADDEADGCRNRCV